MLPSTNVVTVSTTQSMITPLFKSNDSRKIMSYNTINPQNSSNSLNNKPKSSSVSSTVHIGQSSMIRVLYNMLNALIGGGIVGIAYIYKSSGIIGGCLLMLLFAILCTYTLSLMVKCAKISNVHDYEKLCQYCFGINGYIIVCISLLLVDYGVMLTYLIILGDAAFKIANIWGYDTISDRNFILIAIAMIVIFPTCIYRDISALEKLSAIKLAIVVFVVLIVFVEWFVLTDGNISDHNVSYFINWSGIPESVGIIGYAFVCHDSAFLYYNTLIKPTMLRWTQLSFSTVFSAMSLSAVCGIFGYLTFGDGINSNMLNSYPINSNLMIFIRVIFIFIMAWSYPTSFYVVRHIVLESIQKIFYPNAVNRSTVHSSPRLTHICLTSFLFFTNLALALFVRNLGSVMSIVGNLPSMIIAFVMPCLCYLKLHKNELKFWREKTWENKITNGVHIIVSVILPFMGLSIGIYGTINTILN
eukprot:143302_1